MFALQLQLQLPHAMCCNGYAAAAVMRCKGFAVAATTAINSVQRLQCAGMVPLQLQLEQRNATVAITAATCSIVLLMLHFQLHTVAVVLQL